MPEYIAGLSKDENSSRIGVLLVNLGTPEKPETAAVRRYLKQFLWDPRIVEISRPLWWLVLNGIILNTRPRKSAHAYQQVWQSDGSPLLTITLKQARLLNEAFAKEGADIVVEPAMRYGNPSISEALNKLIEKNARKVLVLPAYPQYSATTTASVTDEVFDILKTWRVLPELRIVNQYYKNNLYIKALVSSIEAYWDQHGKPDKLVFSFHSIPKRYIDAGDIYQQQCQKTVEMVVDALSLHANDWIISFQSRLGREEWVKPYTDHVLEALGKQGIARVDVVCPGFSADCLETLEEIDQENRQLFLESGGREYHYIPALNDRESHITCLVDVIESQVNNWK